MTDYSNHIDIQLTTLGPILRLIDDDTKEEGVWIMDSAELASLADKATQALAESKGWEFVVVPAIAVEEGNVLAFAEGTVTGAGTISDGRITELYFDNGCSMEIDSNMRVTILRRIA